MKTAGFVIIFGLIVAFAWFLVHALTSTGAQSIEYGAPSHNNTFDSRTPEIKCFKEPPPKNTCAGSYVPTDYDDAGCSTGWRCIQ